MAKLNHVLPILLITLLLVTRRCLGASLKQSSKARVAQVLLALDVYQDILEHHSTRALRKYQSKYFPKRQPLVNLNLVNIAQKNYSKEEIQNNTAQDVLSRICKLLRVFQTSVYLAWFDEKHNGGSVAETLENLSYAINDTIETAMYLYMLKSNKPLLSTLRVSRVHLNRNVILYKNIFKSPASVNAIRTWRTLFELKYILLDKLAIEVKKLHKTLSM